jgi:rhodanese-related sulfurtransferase
VECYEEISRESLRQKIENREENFTLLEVTSKKEYQESHLPHAINIPLDDIDLLVPRFVANKWEDLVVYGNGPEDVSQQAARLLLSLGYKNVKWYPGGKSDWVGAGLPIESDRRPGERVA